MVLALTILIFVTLVVVIFSFGAAVVTPNSTLGARLRSLGFERQTQPQKPAIKERLEQVFTPLSKALPLSPEETSKTRMWLMQAGYRDPKHITLYFALRVIGVIVGIGIVLALGIGLDSPWFLVGIPGLG